MTLSYTPTTELEAVNMLLKSIGELPVNTLPTEGVSDASIAQDTLHQVSREVQGLGLKCNTDYEYAITPDVDDYINIPTNALRVTPHYRTDDYAVRGRKLYDRENQTFEFDDTVYVDMVSFLEWTDLPEHVRRYIYIKASRRFQSQSVGSPVLHQFSEQDEYEARADLVRWELNKADSTMLETPFIFNIINRRA